MIVDPLRPKVMLFEFEKTTLPRLPEVVPAEKLTAPPPPPPPPEIITDPLVMPTETPLAPLKIRPARFKVPLEPWVVLPVALAVTVPTPMEIVDPLVEILTAPVALRLDVFGAEMRMAEELNPTLTPPMPLKANDERAIVPLEEFVVLPWANTEAEASPPPAPPTREIVWLTPLVEPESVMFAPPAMTTCPKVIPLFPAVFPMVENPTDTGVKAVVAGAETCSVPPENPTLTAP